MTPISDPWFYVVAVPAVILVGLSKGGFGGALALLGVPMMALVIDPIRAAGIMLPILVAMDIAGLIAYRRRFDTKILQMMLPPAGLGIFIGWLTATWVSEAHVRLLVGVVALLFALDYFLGFAARRPPATPHWSKAGFWGTIAGFTSFVSHAGGPPFAMYTLPLRLQPTLLAGTSVIFFAAVNATKLVPYALLGQFDQGNLSTSALLLPLAPLATLTGAWLVRVVAADLFYRIAYIAVFIVSLKLIYDGLHEFLT